MADLTRLRIVWSHPLSRFLRQPPVIALGGVVILLLLYYRAVLTPNSFGFFNDDAIYLTTAKGLATGRGYRLISLPYEPMQTKYPPFYPFLLSLVWRVKPAFPANLKAMMLVAVFSAIAATVLTWFYLTHCEYSSRWIALLAAGMAGANVLTVILSTGVFAEMTFTALSVLGLLLAEVYSKHGRAHWVGMLLGVVMGLAYLTRINGVSLFAAVALYYLVTRRWGLLTLPIGVAGLFVVSWMVWSHANRTSHTETNAVYYTDYSRYYLNDLKDEAAQAHSSLWLTALSRTKSNAEELLLEQLPGQTVGPYLGWSQVSSNPRGPAVRIVFCGALILILLGFRKSKLARRRLLTIYLAAFFAVLLLVPPREIQPRYLIPVLAFLLAFAVTGFADAAANIWSRLIKGRGVLRKVAGGMAFVPLAGIFVFTLLSYGVGANNMIRGTKAGNGYRFSVEAEGLKWIEDNTPKSAVVAAVFHAMYYAYTGRRAVLCFPAEPRLSRPNQVAAVQHLLDENGVAYLVLSKFDFDARFGNIDYAIVVNEMERKGAMEQVFKSRDGLMNIYRYDRGKMARVPSRIDSLSAPGGQAERFGL